MPPKTTVIAYVKRAMVLNEEGTPLPKRPVKPKQELAVERMAEGKPRNWKYM